MVRLFSRASITAVLVAAPGAGKGSCCDRVSDPGPVTKVAIGSAGPGWADDF
jgi:hypothetical protein